jgi:rRNA-processing protein FCF1
MIELIRLLIARHGRSGVIVDTNLLLLYFVGRFAPEHISRFKRTDTFIADDYLLLSLLLRQFQHVVTTPHVLAEVNALSRQLGEPLRTRYFEQFRIEICVLREEYVGSCSVADGNDFVKLGLTDAGIHRLARTPYLVLTGDFPLYNFLASQGLDVINFNHLRPLGWSWLAETRPPLRRLL